MKDISRKLLIIVRYIVAVVVISMILISDKVNFKNITYLIILFLCYVVSIQIRMFISRKNLILLLSILMDLILGFFIYKNYGGPIVLYYFIAIIDAAIMLDKKYAYISFIIVLVFVYYSKVYSYFPGYNDKISIVYNLFLSIVFMALGRYIHYESRGTKEAHELYDELRRSEDELQVAYRRLEQYSNTVEELTLLKERNRISREIHDTVGHTLTTMIMELQALPHIIKVDEKKTNELIESMTSFSKKGLEDVRRAVKDLKPVEFDEYAGIFAIKELIVKFKKVSECSVNLTVSKNQYHLTPDESFILYRVIQESLNNAVKHGHATNIDIIINFGFDKIVTTIRNNGEGCKEIKKGFGITGMEERISKLNGTIEIHSNDVNGFEVVAMIPVQHREGVNE
ncbi:sensor histidine kinase [Clostridium hydrogenum]|uniref:sensor histidine kinase n=1 Tax=Clostridium hydrogenum TaxID=2855764 RepID=UPI001F38D148|nr:sensor histidine kinase [Clostridium hydrogenum]